VYPNLSRTKFQVLELLWNPVPLSTKAVSHPRNGFCTEGLFSQNFATSKKTNKKNQKKLAQ
jgi:hypothetical protein